MKTTAKIFAMIFLLSLGTWMMPQKAQADFGISFQVFYDDLTPYGTWVDNPDYGYVWVPDAGPGFCPYATSGHWVYSMYGWTWVSDYPWGWAPFHYGRWYWDNWYGWVWVPGTEWGPAWVSWRSCNGYYGWAPLAPGFNFSMTWGWSVNVPAAYWIFVPDRYFGRRDLDRYYIDRRDNDRLYRNSNLIGNTEVDRQRNVRYFAGPAASEVSKVTGREIKPVEVRDNNRPGEAFRDGRLEIYRPEVKATASRSSKPAPERVAPYQNRSKTTEPAVRNDRSARPNAEPVIRNDNSTRPNAEPVIRNDRSAKPNSEPVIRNDRAPKPKTDPVIRNERTPGSNSGQGTKYNRPPANNQVKEARPSQQNPGNKRSQYQAKPVEKSGGQQGRGSAVQRNSGGNTPHKSSGEHPHR